MLGSLELCEKMYWRQYVDFAKNKSAHNYTGLVKCAEIIDEWREIVDSGIAKEDGL